MVAEQTIAECARRIVGKPWLAQRISNQTWEDLAAELAEIAAARLVVPPPYPAIGRDPKDDYLIAHAIAARADYLVTGDKDLLVLGAVGGITILSPAACVAVLDAMEQG